MMFDSSIPDEVRRFIANLIPSIPHLEALLLFRSRPDDLWSLGELARRLYIHEKKTQQLVDDLVAMDLVRAGDSSALGFRYAPSTPGIRETIDQLATVYSTHLVEVTHFIHSKTNRKAQQFADAFKWTKDQ